MPRHNINLESVSFMELVLTITVKKLLNGFVKQRSEVMPRQSMNLEVAITMETALK